MSETLKFGNGQWAVKDGSALAFNDENGNFKPLPFTFDRSTSATRVNKQGLIEVVPNNEPRIDFLNDSNGALLLEPSRSNLITYSEDFTQWGSAGTPTVVLSSSLAPNGSLDAYDITDDSTGVYEIKRSNSSSFDGTYTMSIFVKKTTGALSHYAGIQFIGLSDYLIIDTTNGTVNQTASEYSNIKVEDFSNWWRISATGTNTGSTFLINLWAAISSNGTSLSPSATGTNTFFGAMLEQGYPTSYIPTQGSIGTRVAESCEQNLSNQVSLTEGVFYVDVTNLGRTQNANILTQNSTSNSVYGYIQTNNRIVFGLFANSVSVPITSSLEYEIGTRTKIAFHYKSGNSKLYVNGSLVGNSTDTFTLGSSFGDGIRLIDNASAYFAFPEKSILQEFKIYNKALTDQELINLTKI